MGSSATATVAEAMTENRPALRLAIDNGQDAAETPAQYRLKYRLALMADANKAHAACQEALVKLAGGPRTGIRLGNLSDPQFLTLPGGSECVRYSCLVTGIPEEARRAGMSFDLIESMLATHKWAVMPGIIHVWPSARSDNTFFVELTW